LNARRPVAGQALHWLKRGRRAGAEFSAWLLRAMSVSRAVDHPHGPRQSINCVTAVVIVAGLSFWRPAIFGETSKLRTTPIEMI